MEIQGVPFTFGSVLFRLLLSAAVSGVIGYGRTVRGRPSGFRTYMVTGIGATLSVLISLFVHEMLKGAWSPAVEAVGLKFDGSRYAAQVISGVGFIAAGTIISGRHRQAEGLTTAAAMFCTVCIGLAAGAGFYECVFTALFLILLILIVLFPFEVWLKNKFGRMALYVEFDSIEHVEAITSSLEAKHGEIRRIEFEQAEKIGNQYPSVILSLVFHSPRPSRSDVIAAVASLPCVYTVEELNS